MTDAHRYTFRRKHRLSNSLEYQAVYNGKLRKDQWPLTVYGKPNGLNHPRLGLSVSRRVGNAVTRNRIKRLIREAFRSMQHDWPTGFDIIVVVRPHNANANNKDSQHLAHPIFRLADYQRLLHKATRQIVNEWQKRQMSKK